MRNGHIAEFETLRDARAAQACVTGMFELRDFSAFKQHARDFLVQTKSFADKDNVELFAEEAAAAREARPRLMCSNDGPCLLCGSCCSQR